MNYATGASSHVSETPRIRVLIQTTYLVEANSIELGIRKSVAPHRKFDISLS